MAGLRSMFKRLFGKSGSMRHLSQTVVGQTPDGLDIIAFTLTAPSGLSATWLNYGATLQALVLPDGTNVVAGFEDPMRYLAPHPFIGGFIGPVANRISGAAFSIAGRRFQIEANEGDNTLHSGACGTHHKVWDYGVEGDALGLFLSLEDGDGGFPGNREISLIVQLADNALRLEWSIETDADTPVNLTQHSYFNMSGNFETPINGHALQSDATQYTETGSDGIPTGSQPSVAGTKSDFTDPDEIGPRVLDHNLLVPGEGLRELAALTDGVRTLFLNADTPGLQVYTGETLSEVGLPARAAIALEPQAPPDAINQKTGDADTVLAAGETQYGIIEYIFHGPGLPR